MSSNEDGGVDDWSCGRQSSGREIALRSGDLIGERITDPPERLDRHHRAATCIQRQRQGCQ